MVQHHREHGDRAQALDVGPEVGGDVAGEGPADHPAPAGRRGAGARFARRTALEGSPLEGRRTLRVLRRGGTRWRRVPRLHVAVNVVVTARRPADASAN